MSKKKDHIFDTDDIVRSVVLGHEIAASCGLKKTFAREDLDVTEYFDTCKHCMARVAKETPEGGAISVNAKSSWLTIVERAWRKRYEASIKPAVWSTGNTATWTYKIHQWPQKDGS